MNIGQLYVVETRAILKDGTGKVKAMYVLNSDSHESVERKLPYLIDLSLYRQFTIKSIRRIKPNFHVVHCSVFPIGEAVVPVETVVVEQAKVQETVVAWAIAIAGTVLAANGEHALRKLGSYLCSRGTGAEMHSPLHDGVVDVVESGNAPVASAA